jgi:hypothetical protein
MALQTANISASTLDGGINDSVTSLDVVSAASFPASGTFWIRIDTEIMKVTGVSANTFTVVRGESGGGASAAASHSNGAAVTGVLTSQAITQLRADITRWGTHAQMAALTDMKSGDVFYFNGTDTMYTNAVYNGSSWDLYYRGYKCTPPVLGSFTWLNQNSASASAYGGGVLVAKPHSGSSISTLRKSVPSNPYTLRTLVIGESNAGVDYGAGVALISTALVVTNQQHPLFVALQKWTNSTTFSANYATATLGKQRDVLLSEINDNSTNRISRTTGVLGGSWRDLHTVGRTDFLTASECGCVFYSNAGSGSNVNFYWLSWEES